MILTELFAKLGLSTDAASFAKGALAADGIRFALGKLADAARYVTDTLKDATFGVFEQADNLDDLAAKTGVSARALQELGYAGSFADISMESLAQSLRILQKNMAGALEGNDELKKGFRSVGVDLVDSTGKIRDTQDVFIDLADAFARMPTTAARTSAAMKIFGKSGADLLPLLAQGGDGIREMTDEFRSLGAGFDEKFIAGSAEFEDNILRLKTAWSGVKNTVAEAALPALQEFVGTTLEWVKANRELIRTKVREFVEGAVEAIKNFIAGVREWIEEHGGLSAVIDKASKALKVFATFLVVAEVLSFANALLKIPAAIKAIGLAIAANPLGLFLTAIALLVTSIIEDWDDWRYAGILLWQWFEDFTIAVERMLDDFGKDLYDTFVQPFVEAGEDIMDVFTNLANWIDIKLEKIGNGIADTLNKLNPFDINDTSSSGVRGTGVPIVEPVVSAGGGGGAVSLVSSPQINVSQLPGEDSRGFAMRVAEEVDKRNRTLMREAAGGLQ